MRGGREVASFPGPIQKIFRMGPGNEARKGGMSHVRGEEVQGRQVSSEGGEACLM